MPTIYGVALSPFVRKVMISLNIKNISFDQVNITPRVNNDDAEFKKVSPLGKIPAYKDDNIALADSTVICEYIEEAYAGTALLPTDAVARARSRWFEEYADSVLAASVGGMLFFQRIVVPLTGGQPDQDLMQQALTETIPAQVDYLESQLNGDGTYFSGDQVSIGDIAIYSQLINGAHVGFDIDATRWPNINQFMNAMKAVSAIESTLQLDRKILKNFGIETPQ